MGSSCQALPPPAQKTSNATAAFMSQLQSCPLLHTPDTCEVQQIIRFQDAFQPFPLQNVMQMFLISLKCQWLPRDWEAMGYGIAFMNQVFLILMDHFMMIPFLDRWVSYIHLSLEPSTERDCPEKPQSLCSRRFSRLHRTKSWTSQAEFSFDPGLSRRVE